MPPGGKPGRRRPFVDSLSRRQLIGAAGTGGIGLAVAMLGPRTQAQERAATQVAGTGQATPVPGLATPVAGSATPVAGTPRRGGNVRMVRTGPPLGDFNPSAFRIDPQVTVSYLEPLLRPDPSSMRPIPWLATGWTWHEGGRELVFTLRDDVRWHDGTPLTAADVAFSYGVYQSDIASAVSGFLELVEVIDAASDHVLRVRLRELDVNFLFNVATLPIFSQNQYSEIWRSGKPGQRTISDFDWKSENPLGTGPWRIDGWDENEVRFARFDGYWRQTAWLDSLVVAIVDSEQARLEAWRDRETQILWPVRANQLPDLENPPPVLHPAPAASVMFAAFNFANPNQPNGSLWLDPRVRQAASMAINRERYAEEVFDGHIRWNAAGTVSQPWAHDSALTTPPYSPRAAEALLAEAGWIDYDGDGVREDATGVPLRPIVIFLQDSRPELAAVLARVARDLADVGISLQVEALSAREFERRWIVTHDFDLIAYAYDQLPGFTDFDLYGSAWDIRINPTGWNPGAYTNADADAAIAEFLQSVSIELQAKALARLQRAVDEDLFGLWLGFPEDLILVDPDVAGFQPDMAWQTARTWDLWRPAG